MDWSQETLSQCFLQTLSPSPEPRRKAEAYLAESASKPGFAIALLHLISSANADQQIRHAAAVHFKNHVRAHWAPHSPDSDEPPSDPMADADKASIKSHIVQIMLSASPRVQGQISEALSIVSKHDFPKFWPNLLPELVSGLRGAGDDYASINGILGTANSIFKKFRYEFKTVALLLDLKYCLDGFAEPLLNVFLKTAALIPENLNSPDRLRPMIESQRLCCRIFYSLNFQELPAFFEDHMAEWMGEFQKFLTMTYPIEDDKSGNGIAVVDGLRAAVCENISLYMEKNEEEFKGYVQGFASAIWSLLMTASASSSRDQLTVTAIKFLTTISRSVHHSLFGNPDILQQIFESIVVPSIRLRDDDEELFEMNYVEYIRRDIEGSDLDTRRRIACELLKGIAINYKEKVKKMVATYIQNMFASYNANPFATWKDKDCSIYMAVSLATKLAGGGVTTDLFDVEWYFTAIVVPELRSQNVDELPVLKADALKFFTMFRNLIPKTIGIALMPDLAQLLTSESNVVHSYAANCIESLLLQKDNGQPRYTSLDLNPFLPLLLPNLFNALKFPESQENQYIMKCIMRVLGVADLSDGLAAACITGLTAVLGEISKNPKNPAFNHYLFEAVAALLRRSFEKEPSLILGYEACLLPILQSILVNNITEFWPYAFQILAQLIELHTPPLPPNYMSLFEILLSPVTWSQPANVPALVRLLQAYLQKAPNEMDGEGRLARVLGIFNQLVSVLKTHEFGFYVLNTVVENLCYEVLSPYISHIWGALFMQLQKHRTLKFVKSLVIFMSLFSVKHGHALLVGSINAVQANIFTTILEQFWIPNLKLIMGTIELKLTSVASTRLICESPIFLEGPVELWGKMLDSIVTLLARPEQERVEHEPEVPDFVESPAYTTTFFRLYNAGKKEDDPLKEVKDPREFLVMSLARLSSSSPGKYSTIIQTGLDQANQAALLQLCSTYNCSIA